MKKGSPSGNPPGSLQWLIERPFAHRGLHDAAKGAPENSLAAFDRAAGRGFGIELDVRLLADGSVAVFHDDKLERMTGVRGAVGRLDSGAFGQLILKDSNQPPPLLAETLEAVAGRVPLLIEIKEPTEEAAAAVEAACAGYGGLWAALSFHAQPLAWFRRWRPERPRGLNGGEWDLSRPWARRFASRHLLGALTARPHFIGYDLNGFPAPVPRLLRRLGTPVLAWTVRDSAQQARARRFADNIIFEGFGP